MFFSFPRSLPQRLGAPPPAKKNKKKHVPVTKSETLRRGAFVKPENSSTTQQHHQSARWCFTSSESLSKAYLVQGVYMHKMWARSDTRGVQDHMLSLARGLFFLCRYILSSGFQQPTLFWELLYLHAPRCGQAKKRLFPLKPGPRSEQFLKQTRQQQQQQHKYIWHQQQQQQ